MIKALRFFFVLFTGSKPSVGTSHRLDICDCNLRDFDTHPMQGSYH